MKKKAIIITLAIAITLTVAKTGYAYYEKINSENVTKEEQTTQEAQVSKVTRDSGLQTAIVKTVTTETAAAPGSSEDSANNSYNGCNYGFGNMFDENGNLKERAVYEQELDEYIIQGKISEDDKEYYLSLYDTCVSNFSQIPSATENGVPSESAAGESDATGNDNEIAFGRDFNINLEECH
jgi:hypothetical protein